jgi:hypothetical protein
MSRPEFMIRLMVERAALADAAADALALAAAVEGFGSFAELSLAPYAKFDNTFQITLRLAAGADGPAALPRLAAALAPDWHWAPHPEDAVWDHRNNGPFKVAALAPVARWANVAVYDADA